jgi:RNA polymerase sigma-70 factor (ECF subfamily)
MGYVSDHGQLAAGPDAGSPGGDGLDLLLKATARGELAAFELLYQRLSAPVYGAILAVLRDQAQAEEVAQEVFLEIWQLAARYDASKGTVPAWVMTIARRRAIDRVRSAAAAAARERRDAPVPSPDQVGEDAVEREQLRRCLSSLSAPQREAILLAFYGGYTHTQVAGVLGVPLGTVKTRIRDGLARLRYAMLDGAASTSSLGHAVISGLRTEAAAAEAPAGPVLSTGPG